jgi:hypothetical protein
VFCTTWRKGARRIWTLPPNAYCDLLYAVANYKLIFYEFCHRMYNFLFSCLNSDSRLLGLLYYMACAIGINFYAQLGLSLPPNNLDDRLSGLTVHISPSNILLML